ncbi:MAG: hypothetical protein ACFFD4_10805 [Candidatus Odinarchaeota archaeon]
MKKKLAFLVFCSIFLVQAIFIASTGTASTTEDSVEWHENVRKSLTGSWEVVQMSGTPTFAGQTITSGALLNFTFIQDPSTQFDRVFGEELPSWYEIRYQGTKLENAMFTQLEIEFLYGFFFPITVNWDNGTQSSLESFLQYFKPPDFNSTSSQPSGGEGNGYTTMWVKETGSGEDQEVIHIEFITSAETGVTDFATFHFDSPTESYHFMFRLTGYMHQEEESEEPEDMPTSIKWHGSVKKDAIFAWNVTEFNQTSGDPFSIGGTVIKAGDVIQFGLVKNAPTDPMDWLESEGPPDWVNLFINTNMINLASVGSEGEMLLFLLLPIEASYDNGTKIDLKGFFDGYVGDNDEFLDYQITTGGSYYDVTWSEEWDDGDESGSADYHVRTTIMTGITVLFEVNATEGHFKWEYLPEAANVDPEGEPKTVNSEYTVELSYPPAALFTPGFGFYSVFVMISCAVIIRKKK